MKKKIKHHLYGFTSVSKNFSTGLWLSFAIKKINHILKKKKIPILVGGTGLYLKSLIDGLVKMPNIPNLQRKKIRKYHQEIGQQKFYEELVKLDPKVKNFIFANDIQRSIRAYEVKKITNKSFYDWIKETKPFFDIKCYKKIFYFSFKRIAIK